jgi:hypothetical protein
MSPGGIQVTTERDDERELRRLGYGYARMIDRRDWEAIPQVFLADARLSGLGFDMKGHDELRSGLAKIDVYSATLHCVHNQVAEVSGDRATGEVYCVANHIYEKEGVPFKLDMGIRYEDRYERGPDGWRIEARVLNLVWQQDLPLELTGTAISSG